MITNIIVEWLKEKLGIISPTRYYTDLFWYINNSEQEEL